MKSAIRGKRNFAASVSKFITVSEARVDAVVKESTQRVIEEAQLPVAKGGKMRVDTSFLRNSGVVSLTGMPSGPSRPTGDDAPQAQDVNAAIANAAPGASIWFGWTANYARPREYADGFLRSAAQNWRSIVSKVAGELKERINGR